MPHALFAELYVRSLAEAVPWYERLLGGEASFYPNDVEAVWELEENRSIVIVEGPEHAGHSLVTVFLTAPDDLEARVAGIAARGIEPALREVYENGVRKVTYRDPDGNEIGFGGAPLTGDE